MSNDPWPFFFGFFFVFFLSFLFRPSEEHMLGTFVLSNVVQTGKRKRYLPKHVDKCKRYTHTRTHRVSLSLSLSLVSSLSHLIFFLYGRRRRDFQGEEQGCCTALHDVEDFKQSPCCNAMLSISRFSYVEKKFLGCGRGKAGQQSFSSLVKSDQIRR